MFQSRKLVVVMLGVLGLVACEENADQCEVEMTSEDVLGKQDAAPSPWNTSVKIQVVDRDTFCARSRDCASTLSAVMGKYDCDGMQTAGTVRVSTGCGVTVIVDQSGGASATGQIKVFDPAGRLIAAQSSSDTSSYPCATFGQRFGEMPPYCESATVKYCRPIQAADAGSSHDAAIH